MIVITARRRASSRTRNRLREHPGAFELKETSNPVCLAGRVAHLLEHPDGWIGWLPADELQVKP